MIGTNTIALRDALSLMENSEAPFQVKFVTFNKSSKTGGKIIELTRAVRVGASFNLKDNDMIQVKQLDTNNHPHPIHIHLITEFNNKKVHV